MKFGSYLNSNGNVYILEPLDKSNNGTTARIWENDYVVCLISGKYADCDETRLKYLEILEESKYIGNFVKVIS